MLHNRWGGVKSYFLVLRGRSDLYCVYVSYVVATVLIAAAVYVYLISPIEFGAKCSIPAAGCILLLVMVFVHAIKSPINNHVAY
jgi:hypothetical protein